MSDWDGFELRYDRFGRCAVRVAGDPARPVLARHVEPLPLTAPWVAEARCGMAVGWLLAAAPPPDPEGARTALAREVERRTALTLQRHVEQLAAFDAELLERLTHRLRTDVMTLEAVVEGGLNGAFEPEEHAEVQTHVKASAAEAQRRITAAREVMGVLDPATRRSPEPILRTLSAELEGAGREVTVTVQVEEEAWTLIPGPGWAACARRLADVEELDAITITPDPDGWRISAVGDLSSAAHLVVAAGGVANGALILPAAPASG
jgi:hypothetical protein